jgi:hypothetical protein
VVAVGVVGEADDAVGGGVHGGGVGAVPFTRVWAVLLPKPS